MIIIAAALALAFGSAAGYAIWRTLLWGERQSRPGDPFKIHNSWWRRVIIRISRPL